MKRNPLTIIISVVLAAVFIMLLFVFQVRQSEVALKTFFGKPSATYDKPGAYIKWPWPIEEVYKFDKRVQSFEDKFNQGFTADNNNLIVSVYVGWHISDAAQFFPKFQGSVHQAQLTLESILRSAQTGVIGKHTLSELVNTDPKALKFDEIEQEIEQAVQTELALHDYGIKVDFLGFKKIELPEAVTQSVFERMKEERQLLISKENYDGQRDAVIIKAQADRQAAELVANAQAEAIRIKGEGEAAAAPTLKVFEQNPDLYIFLLHIDAVKQSLSKNSTLIFDDHTPPFDLFQSQDLKMPAPQP
jgi:membrane protease subunit HflC